MMEPHREDNVILYSSKALIQRYTKDGLAQTGAELAYFFVLSLFPFLMLLNQVIAMFNYDIHNILRDFETLIPENMLTIIYSYLGTLSGSRSTGIFTFGAVSTILVASKAVQSLIRSLTKAFRVDDKLGIVRIVISFSFTLMLILLIPISIVFSSIGRTLFERATTFLGIGEQFIHLWPYFRFLVPFGGVVLVLTILYNIIPRKGFPRKYTIFGALFATGIWVIMAVGLSYYTSNFGNYSVVYGSLGAVMIMLLFLYWSGIIIVMGGELAHILAMRSLEDFSHDTNEIEKVLL